VRSPHRAPAIPRSGARTRHTQFRERSRAVCEESWRLPKASRRESAQNVTADHEPLYLGCPLADLAYFRVAHHPLDGIVLGVTVTAVDLHSLCGGAHCQLGAEQLGHRRFLAERLAMLRQPRGVKHEMPPRLDLGRHVGQLKLHALEIRDRLPELLALRRVSERLLVRSFGNPE